MEWFSAVDWDTVLTPGTPLLEIIVRGTVIYLSLIFLMRVILSRFVGSIGVTDLLLVVLIADAAQNGMGDDYRSLPDGIVLVCTLLFWNYVLEWLSFHFPFFERLIQSPPVILVRDGRMLRKNMRRELITEEDLMTQLRLQGVEEVNEVKKACLEGDGKISVIQKKSSK